LKEAGRQLEWHRPAKIFIGLATSVISLLIQFVEKVQPWQSAWTSAVCGIAAYGIVNFVAFVVTVFSIPPKLRPGRTK